MTWKYLVLPRRHVNYGGNRRASVGFNTKEGARRFVRRRGLSGAILMKRK